VKTYELIDVIAGIIDPVAFERTDQLAPQKQAREKAKKILIVLDVIAMGAITKHAHLDEPL